MNEIRHQIIDCDSFPSSVMIVGSVHAFQNPTYPPIHFLLPQTLPTKSLQKMVNRSEGIIVCVRHLIKSAVLFCPHLFSSSSHLPSHDRCLFGKAFPRSEKLFSRLVDHSSFLNFPFAVLTQASSISCSFASTRDRENAIAVDCIDCRSSLMM